MTLNSKPIEDLSKSHILEDKNVEKIETEKTNGSLWLERKTFRVALIGIFTAVTIVLGYLLAEIPNIEVFTMMIFLSGFILSKKEGAIIGLLSAAIFTFFNPINSYDYCDVSHESQIGSPRPGN
ncbi:MAG: ECF transporter S component [Promethearchaeota archaeon]